MCIRDRCLGFMAAGSALADVAWFGTSSASGLPSLDGAAADFAESVGYVVPKFGSLHEPRLMVNLLYTQEAWSAYEAVQIAAYSLSNPTADFVPFFGRWTPMPVQAPPVSDAEARSSRRCRFHRRTRQRKGAAPR